MEWMCINEDCDVKFKVINEAIETIIVDNEGNVTSSVEKCPMCGHKRRKIHKWDGGTFASPGNKNISNK